MALPYSYKSKIIINNTELFDLKEVIGKSFVFLKNNDYKKTELKSNEIVFISNQSLTNFDFGVSLSFYKEENITIEYEFKLEQLIKITIVLILLIAFFSSFSMSGFLWFSFIISVIFYGANLIFIDSNVQKIIKSLPVYQISNPKIDEKLSEEQNKWMNDKNKCSGCGEQINKYDSYCPECGLKLNNNNYTIPLDVTKYKNKRFTYHYKDKKDNK